MFRQIHRAFFGIAYLLAVLGGVVLTAIILMVCLSILGRTTTSILHSGFMQGTMPGVASWLLGLGIGPIRGDYELLESGMAFSVFAFLSWCQITAGHATVDVFTAALRDRWRRYLQMVIEIAFAMVMVLIAVQLYDGLQTQIRRRSVTFLLQYPVWWSYLAATIPAVIVAGIAVYMALVRIAEAVLNRPLIDPAQGAEH